MALQFILGNSGVGKTHHIYHELIARSSENIHIPLILIVPEQYTLQTQQEIIQLHPRKGIMNIEVLSFGRLAYRIYTDLSIADKTLLKEPGKSMVVRKLIEDAKEKYPTFSANIKKKGYIKELKGLMTEFFQYDWQPEHFDAAQDKLKNPLLKEKLKDAQVLFADYKNYLLEHYITTENTLNFLVEAISKNTWLEDAEIYIDGFYGFTPVQYHIILELVKKSRNVHITISIDQKEDLHDLQDESQLFFESKEIIKHLEQLVLKEDINIDIRYIGEEAHRFKAHKDLAHLERNLFRYPYKTYEAPSDSIYLCYGSTMRTETRYVADAIMKLVMKEHYHFKDIAVVTGDLMGYETVLKQVFELYEIPYFMDKKKPIISHPLVEMLLAALEIIYKDFTYDSIFRYIKTGLLDLDQGTVDCLENYVLAYGYKGYKTWEQEWQKPYPYMNQEMEYSNKLVEEINDIKAQILKPLIQLKEAIHVKGRTVLTVSKGLLAWLQQLNLEQRMDMISSEFEAQGELIYQKEYHQIYPMIMEILEQMVGILGNQKVTIRQYATVLKAGFEECEMGLVPPGLDQVVIGDLERTRLNETKALFVIGFNEGKVPKAMDRVSIVSDVDRTQLKEIGLQIAPDLKENIYKEQFSLYMALTRVSEKLYLSYAKSDLQGKPLRASMLFHTLHKIYPNKRLIDIDALYLDKCVVNKPKPTFHNLVSKMNSMNTELIEKDQNLKALYQWFYDKLNWQPVIDNFEKAFIIEKEPNLMPGAVEDLYGKVLKNSVSRLEVYAKCPFAHFMDYGLQLHERLDYTIKMPDIGILFHKAIDKCSRKIDFMGLDWNNIKDDIRDQLVEEAVSEVVSEEKRGLFISSARNIYLIKRLTRITKRAVWAISKQISKGDFRPVEYEFGFDGERDGLKALNIDFTDKHAMKLSGRVDRIDAFEDEDTLYLTVVDYKSGNKSFDMVALYYGLQLQLLVYLNSVTEMKKNTLGSHKKVIPAGVFYFHIDDPIIKDVPNRNTKHIEAQILKELKLKGLVLDQKDIIRKLDGSFEKSSDVIPVALTVDGELSKVSSVASLEQFEHLKQYVVQETKNIGTAIIEGNLAPNPYKRKNETGCDFCQYLSVCRFEQNINGNNYRILKDFSIGEFWETIKK